MTDPTPPTNPEPPTEPPALSTTPDPVPPTSDPGPPGAYGVPVAGPAVLPSEERTNAMFAWLGAIIAGLVCGLGFIGPLIVLLTSGARSPFVRAHAVESLNLQITVAIASIGAMALWFLAFVAAIFVPFLFLAGFIIIFLPIGASIYGLVISILGAVRANNGEIYRAPVTLRFVK